MSRQNDAVGQAWLDAKPELGSQLLSHLDALGEGLWYIDANNITTFVNPPLARMLGYRVDEMIGTPLWDYVDPERRAEAQSRLQRRRLGVVERHEFCFTRRDGTNCYALLSATPIHGAQGEYAGALAMVTDLTRSQGGGVREAERLLTTVTSNMDEGVLGLDPAGRVVFANGRACELFDRANRDLIGANADVLLDLRTEGDSLRRVWQAGRPVEGTAHVKIADSERLTTVSYHAWPQFSGVTPDGTVVLLRDISAEQGEEDRRARDLDAMVWVGRTKDALDEGRLCLYAQPVVELSSGAVVSHELLIRMRDTTGRIVLPGTFLPAAERYGLIRAIDRWVLSKGIRLAAAGLPVDINLSGDSIGDRAMLRHIEAELSASGADPTLVTFEVTETAVMTRIDAASRFVRDLRARGCGVALDDFGTGFGTFTYLKQLPATRLKIDRQFVHNLAADQANQHVVRAIVDLAKGFGQATVAEGVEDPESLALLRAYGVDFAQGLHLGRPEPINKLRPMWPADKAAPLAA